MLTRVLRGKGKAEGDTAKTDNTHTCYCRGGYELDSKEEAQDDVACYCRGGCELDSKEEAQDVVAVVLWLEQLTVSTP